MLLINNDLCRKIVEYANYMNVHFFRVNAAICAFNLGFVEENIERIENR